MSKARGKPRQSPARHLKTAAEIALMREAGLLVWEAHRVAAGLVRPDTKTAEINEAVEAFLASRNAIPLFKGVPGIVPFPAAACISVNSAVVHGIPGPRRLREGDVVSIDIGAKVNGWCADAAVTYAGGTVDPETQRLLDVTEASLRLAIEMMGKKHRWSQVAREIEQFVKDAGFSVVQDLSGHSIGQEMWEGLQAPNFTTPDFERRGDFRLEPGVVLAVEPMVNAGTRHVMTLADHWTVATMDGKPSAHFEHTVALTEQGPQVLTAGPDGTGWAIG